MILKKMKKKRTRNGTHFWSSLVDYDHFITKEKKCENLNYL